MKYINYKKINERKKWKHEESNINISYISPNQICAMDEIVFICGKIKYKINEKLIFEYLNKQIINNKVIDQKEKNLKEKEKRK